MGYGSGPVQELDRDVYVRLSARPPRADYSRQDPNPEQIVLGVDTRKDIHVAAVATTLGAQAAYATLPTIDAGF